jgi:hypothetical protein
MRAPSTLDSFSRLFGRHSGRPSVCRTTGRHDSQRDGQISIYFYFKGQEFLTLG